MNVDALKDSQVAQVLIDLFTRYSEASVLLGLILPFVDAFLPFLPLWAFITVNIYAFGFVSGFLVSWIGSVLGNGCVFFILRRLGRNNVTEFLYRSNKNNSVLSWVDNASFVPMFLYFSMPFTPAFVLVIFAAIARVKASTFILALVTGKFVMIFFIAYVGKDFAAIVEKPIKGVVYALIIVIVWLIGKRIENRLAIKGKVKNGFGE